ncbi:MAG: hypothetical protein IT450_22195, partial [Phycisphaerales bacterium]|nr:hypothetical protein [Phycisphaerales bacterium]
MLGLIEPLALFECTLFGEDRLRTHRRLRFAPPLVARSAAAEVVFDALIPSAAATASASSPAPATAAFLLLETCVAAGFAHPGTVPRPAIVAASMFTAHSAVIAAAVIERLRLILDGRRPDR